MGRLLAQAGIQIVYGGGSVGSMGALADAALAEGGKVVGVIPRFMDELEWSHRRLTDLRVVADMHERKRLMLDGSDAVVALPGGSGTFEELFEAITMKRLGLYFGPIIIVNTRGYFGRFCGALEHAVHEGFMDSRHLAMWDVVDTPAQVLPAIQAAAPWSAEARRFASV
jgi:uncharacterized protein (TIGR00730 family)